MLALKSLSFLASLPLHSATVGDIGLLFSPGIFHGLKKILSSPKAYTLECPCKKFSSLRKESNIIDLGLFLFVP